LSVANRKGYAGYEFDEAARVYHVRHRVYMPDNGKWTRRDPLGYVDGMGLYEYVRSRSLLAQDHSGKASYACPLASACNEARDDDANDQYCTSLRDAMWAANDKARNAEERLSECMRTGGDCEQLRTAAREAREAFWTAERNYSQCLSTPTPPKRHECLADFADSVPAEPNHTHHRSISRVV
jgi:RHS repeat-associated protein